MTLTLTLTYVVKDISLHNFSLYMLPPIGLSFRDIHINILFFIRNQIHMYIRVTLIFNLRFLLLSPPNMVPFHKKKVPEKDYCNRTTGKGADHALKFRIHQ